MLNANHLWQIAKYKSTPLAIAHAHASQMLDVGLDMLARAGSMRGAARAPARSSQNRSGRTTIKMHGVFEGGAPGIFTMLGLGFSTQAIEREIALAVMDDNCNEIVLEMNSPGGSIEGVPELVAAVRAAAARKIVTAMVAYRCCSAAYWVASQADRVIASPSSEVGSIGVYVEHQDVSGAMAKAGVTNTYVSAGRYKVEGRSDAPLSTDATAWMQQQVDAIYMQFTNAVAYGRNVSRAEVMKNYGQGRSMSAADAKKCGMVDHIAASVDAAPFSRALAEKQIRTLSRRG